MGSSTVCKIKDFEALHLGYVYKLYWLFKNKQHDCIFIYLLAGLFEQHCTSQYMYIISMN